MPKARLYRLGLFNFKDYPDGRLGDSDVNFKLYEDTEDYNNLPDDAVKFLKDVLLYNTSEISAKPDTEVTGYFAVRDNKLEKDYNIYVSAYATRNGEFETSYSVKEFNNGWVEMQGDVVIDQFMEMLQASERSS